MNGEIALFVALTCHGNAFLSGQKIGAFFPNNSTCIFCDRIKFVILEKRFLRKPREKEVAPSPDEWFFFLNSLGARGIRLSRTPQNPRTDRESAGFVGGGGTWAMEVLFPENRSEYWMGRWEGSNQNAPDKRIWRVTYARVSCGVTSKHKPYSLPEITARMTNALREIRAFSEKHHCSEFTKCFSDALHTIESVDQYVSGYHKDLAPDGFLSATALALLHACQHAWVFGCMGSWNDMSFNKDEQKEYDRVSENLFQIVNKAILAAANSTCKE